MEKSNDWLRLTLKGFSDIDKTKVLEDMTKICTKYSVCYEVGDNGSPHYHARLYDVDCHDMKAFLEKFKRTYKKYHAKATNCYDSRLLDLERLEDNSLYICKGTGVGTYDVTSNEMTAEEISDNNQKYWNNCIKNNPKNPKKGSIKKSIEQRIQNGIQFGRIMSPPSEWELCTEVHNYYVEKNMAFNTYYMKGLVQLFYASFGGLPQKNLSINRLYESVTR